MARLLAITAFPRHASAVTRNHDSLGTAVIINHGICTARFCGKRKPRFAWYIEPGLAAPEAALAAPEPRLPAPAVEPSTTDPEPAGDAPAYATPFVGVPLLAVPSVSLMLACQMLSSAMWIVRASCGFLFDGVAFRSRDRKRKTHIPVLHTECIGISYKSYVLY